ncbi:MAG TPA: M4 family metallopeptidase [Candidatus Hydrogenedentes bacterium]|nr:M4 family metallopeptidase [Candidatus Hydrogenedentota bacterium]HPG69753.1 M4 family metallopeptidase [Candidatus Hydrogenedentota bacterium]
MFGKAQTSLGMLAAILVWQVAAAGQVAGDAGARKRTVDALVDSVQGGGVPADVRIARAPGAYVRSISAPPSSYFPVALGQGAPPADSARAFLERNKSVFMDDAAAAAFRAVKVKTRPGRSYVRLQQTYSGIPVFGAEAVVQLNEAGQVEFALVDIQRDTEDLQDGRVTLSPTLSAAEAESRALALARPRLTRSPGADAGAKVDPDAQVLGWLLGAEPSTHLEARAASLMIFVPEVVGSGGDPRLVWQTAVSAVDNPAISELVLVDAHSGDITFHYPLAHAALNRLIYDANNSSSNPGTLVRSEGQGPVGSPADVNYAYDYFGDTYDFYSVQHGRDSLNGAGMTLSGTMRYCDPSDDCPMANAFWSDSTERMYFGEGYASADDVVGHELTHGVTSYESALIYFNQSGAINEAFSDMWGEWIDQTNGAGTDTPAAKWLVGEDLPIGAIRDMSNPPAYGDPDRMGSPLYNANIGDVGGVHYNNGVGNKLCYLLTDGGTFNGHTVTGFGISSTADLLYECAVHLLTSAADYLDLYMVLLQAADNLGYSQAAKNNVVEACLAVELGVEPDKLAVGSYAGYWVYPMYTSYHDSRTQSIYLASEIGRSGRITALSLYVTTLPGQTLNYWTIRMKTTSLSAYTTASMDAAGWTVCYQANETVGSTGQRTFTFSTPFQYDGTSNLMIDFSHNNTSYTSAGECLGFTPGGYRSVIARSDSTNGDPLTWSGVSSPTKTRSTAVPCVALTFSPASATVTNVTSAHANGSFTVGEVIDIDVTFSTTVAVTGSPRLELETGATNRMATFLSGSGTSALRFRYTVAAGDSSADLDYTNGGALQFNGGTVRDTATLTTAVLTLPASGAAGSLGANKAIVIDTTAPMVSGVTSSLTDGFYTIGQVVPVDVTFNEAVTYTAGTGVAQVQLETGATDRQAPCADGSGTTVLTFNYAVQSGDTSADLDYLSTGALTLTGSAAIRDTAGNNAVLTLPALGSPTSLGGNKAIVIDTTAPTGSLIIDGDAPVTFSTEVELALTYSDGGGSGVTQMRFNNDGSSWSDWEAVGGLKAWTLSPGYGVKTVYAQYQDRAGNLSSVPISDDISYEAETIAVTVTPDTWAIGPRALSYVGESGTFTVTNAGNIVVDVTVKGGHGTGGWLLQNTPGPNAFALEVDGLDDGSYETVLTTTEQPFADAMPVSSNRTLGLRYRSPTSDTYGAGVAQDVTVTFKASLDAP